MNTAIGAFIALISLSALALGWYREWRKHLAENDLIRQLSSRNEAMVEAARRHGAERANDEATRTEILGSTNSADRAGDFLRDSLRGPAGAGVVPDPGSSSSPGD